MQEAYDARGGEVLKSNIWVGEYNTIISTTAKKIAQLQKNGTTAKKMAQQRNST